MRVARAALHRAVRARRVEAVLSVPKTIPPHRCWIRVIAAIFIDFATHLNGDEAEADQPSEFKLLVEERRIVESIAEMKT